MTPPLSGCRTMHRLLDFTPSQIATWSDLMRDHSRRRPFPGVGRKADDELEYDEIEYAALPVVAN